MPRPRQPTLQKVERQGARGAPQLHQFGLVCGVLLSQQALTVSVVVGASLRFDM